MANVEYEDGNSPPPHIVAKQLLGAMATGETMQPVGDVIALGEDDEPVYMIVAVFGAENVRRVKQAIDDEHTMGEWADSGIA